MERSVFHAMGTDVEILLDVPSSVESRAALARAASEFDRLEGLFSRFRPESELMRLNAAGGREVGVELRELVALALAARERTGGRFDPTVHDAVVAAGYDRSFELLAAPVARAAAPAGGRVEIRGERIVLEPGVHLDLGGIAKGYAADRVASRLGELGPALVNAGGDIAVSGTPADGPWPVGVEIPEGELTLGVASGALATSGRDRRRWVANDTEQHHLIDPATGAPAVSDLLRVICAAPSAAEAEVEAKWLFLAGEEEAAGAGIPAVLITAEGRVRLVGGLA
jgi:thiamine biosynthesis lipoprotein